MITTAQNVEYKTNKRNWILTRDFIEGDVSTIANRYLIPGYHEQTVRYNRRKQLADFSSLTSSLLSKVLGVVLKEQPIRTIQNQIIPDQFFESGGPNGESYEAMINRLAHTLLAYGNATTVVQTNEQGNPTINVKSPLHTPRWTSTETIITSMIEQSENITEDQQLQKSWIVYSPDQWRQYVQEKDEMGNVQDVLIAQNSFGHTFFDEDGEARSPAQVHTLNTNTELAMGTQLAYSHKAIFQHRSSVDSASKEAMNSGLIQVGVDGKKEAENISHHLKKDSPFIPYNKKYGEHKPLSLPTGPIEEGREILKEKEDKLSRLVGLYADQATQGPADSATQAQITSETGLVGFARLVRRQLQSIEESVLHTVAQANNIQITNAQIRDNIDVDYQDIDIGVTQ